MAKPRATPSPKAKEWLNEKWTEKGEHSLLGPSSSSRWMKCPASVKFSRDIPDTTSEYAKEGTLAHLVTEYCRLENVRADELIGLKIDGVEVTKEMANHTQEFCDLCAEFDGVMLAEYKVYYGDYVTVELDGETISGFGTADDIRLKDGHAAITDFKYGKGVEVEAKDNSQLLLLALGVYQNFDYMYDFKRFTLSIHQPRSGGWKSVDITTKQLLAWAEKKLKPAVAKVEVEKPRFLASNARNGHCRFCPARSRCKAKLLSFVKSLPEEPMISPGRMSEVIDGLEGVQLFLSELEDEAKKLAIAGTDIGHRKVVDGRRSHSHKNEDETKSFLKNKGYKEEDYMVKPKLQSVSQIKKMLTAPQREEYEKNELYITKAGKPVLVPGWDRRPSIAVNPETEFSEVDFSKYGVL